MLVELELYLAVRAQGMVPEGIGRMFELLGERLRPRRTHNVAIAPDLPRLARALEDRR